MAIFARGAFQAHIFLRRRGHLRRTVGRLIAAPGIYCFHMPADDWSARYFSSRSHQAWPPQAFPGARARVVVLVGGMHQYRPFVFTRNRYATAPTYRSVGQWCQSGRRRVLRQ